MESTRALPKLGMIKIKMLRYRHDQRYFIIIMVSDCHYFFLLQYCRAIHSCVSKSRVVLRPASTRRQPIVAQAGKVFDIDGYELRFPKHLKPLPVQNKIKHSPPALISASCLRNLLNLQLRFLLQLPPLKPPRMRILKRSLVI